MNSFFQFKQFKIEQNKCAMKVSTDACIQGAWSDVPLTAKRVLDIGTGTGLLSLMLAQKNCDIIIDAVEINSDAAYQAKENFIASPWAKRLRVIEVDIKSFEQGGQYDYIICNPPFFNNSLQSLVAARNVARHTSELSYIQLLDTISSLLSAKGSASILLPIAEHDIWEDLLRQYGWCINKQLDIQPLPYKPKNRVVSICSRKFSVKQQETLCIYEEPGKYTEAFAKLLSPYYLNL